MSELPLKRESVRRQVLLALALALALGLLLAGAIAAKHGLFSRQAELYFVADSAAGITPGLSVRLSGFRIGSVSDVALQDDLKVRVTMQIEAERFAALRADAHAEWFKEQLQAAVIDLNPGVAAAPLSPADPRVTLGRRRTLTEVANDLRNRLVPILDDLKQVSSTVAQRKDDLGAALANTQAASAQLAAASSELRALLSQARGRVSTVGEQAQQAMGQVPGLLSQVGQTLVRLDGAAQQARGTLDGVNARLPALLSSSGDTLEQLNGAVRDLRAVSAAASATLPGVLRSTGPLLDDTRDMVGGVRAAWPVRALVAPPPSALVPLDSHDGARLRESNAR